MSRYNLIVLGSASFFIILLSAFIFFWSYRVPISYDAAFFDDFISKREAVSDSAAEQQILKLTKMSKELQKKASDLNFGLLRIFRKLAFVLLGVALIQFTVLYAIRKSSTSANSKGAIRT